MIFPMAVEDESVGRYYEIDYLDVLDGFNKVEGTVLETMTPENEENGQKENLDGLCNYLIDEFKSSRRNRLSLTDVDRLLEHPDTRYHLKRLGIVYFFANPLEFDLCTSSGDPLIVRGTGVTEIILPHFYFPEEGGTLPPQAFSRSLGMLSDYLFSEDLDSEYIVGLTHPRLGNLASKRWGFQIEEHPFPKEIYRLFEVALKNEEYDLVQRQSMEAFSRQVLVYQSREDFLKRRSLEEKASEKEQAVRVVEFTPETERRSLRWKGQFLEHELSVTPISTKLTDEEVLKLPRVVAVIRQNQGVGKVQLNQDLAVSFKTELSRPTTVYRYSPGVKVVPVVESSLEGRHAIIIPRGSNSYMPPIVYLLGPEDKVIDPDRGLQIYP